MKTALRAAALLIPSLLTAQPLRLQPALSWSAWFGSAGGDRNSGPVVDRDGNIWITGRTGGQHPITPDALQPNFGGGTCGIPDPRTPFLYPCGDVFITKLDPTGTKILYSTYLGGSGEDYGRQIATDNSGNIYVLGQSQSVDFPSVSGAIGSGPVASFLLKLSPAGKSVWLLRLTAATTAFAVDGSGSVYLAGRSANNDASVAKLSADATSVAWTYNFGGSGADFASVICVDRTGAAYVGGFTQSADFPVTAQALEPQLTAYTMFAAKVKPDGSGLAYATYFSGGITAMACDDNGSAYLTGVAVAGFHTTPGAPQTVYNQVPDTLPGDAFVAKLNGTGTGLVYATYLGGSRNDAAFGIAVDAAGVATVVGTTDSADFPLVSPLQHSLRGTSDGFVTRVNAPGTAFLYSTYLGGNGQDIATGVALDAAGGAVVRGCGGESYSCLPPPQPGVSDDSRGAPASDNAVNFVTGARGIFVASIALTGQTVSAPRLYQNGMANLASGNPTAAVPGGIVQVIGYGLGPAVPVSLQLGADGKVASSLAGVRLLFDGIAAPLLMVNGDSIQAIVPFEVAGRQQTLVTVETPAGRTNPVAFAVSDADPAVLSADGIHAAAVNEDGTVNSPNNPAAPGSVVSVYAIGTGQTAPPEADGSLVSLIGPLPQLQVAAEVGGRPAQVLYAGGAPGLVAGVAQINVRLPAGVRLQDAGVLLTVGRHRATFAPVISVR